MSKSDPRGYYAALRVGPDASAEEIALGFRLLEQQYKEGNRPPSFGRALTAFKTLSNPRLRREYDGHAPRAGLPERPAGRSRFESIPLLLSLVTAFAGTFGYLFAPLLMGLFIQFDTGDELYWKKTGRPVGIVVDYAEEYDFPEGEDQAAYRIRAVSGREQWLPAGDLNRHCGVR